MVTDTEDTFEACMVYRAFLDLPTLVFRPCDVSVAIILSKFADLYDNAMVKYVCVCTCGRAGGRTRVCSDFANRVCNC